MGKYLKTSKEAGNFLGLSDPRGRPLLSKGLPRRADGKHDPEKVIAWNTLRLEKHRNPKPKEVTPEALRNREITVADVRDIAARFQNSRAEVLVRNQARLNDLTDRIVSSISDDDILEMKATEKASLLKVAGTVQAIMYDKERLERGQSTENVSVLVSAIKRIKQKKKEAYGGI